jgi:hypothetical protein
MKRPRAVPASDTAPDPPAGGQLSLFPGVTGSQPEAGPPDDCGDAPIVETQATDRRQIELFADHVVLARDLDAALSAGRFEEAAQLHIAIADAFGPSEWETLRDVARGRAGSEDPAMAFWACLRAAESRDCPDDLLHQARRRMKQLRPDLHALLMRWVPPG